MTETPRIIEAEKFVLRDSKGRRRAELGTQSDDNPELVLLNDQEQPQARFSIKFGSASIELLNGVGVKRVTMEAGLEIGGSASPSITLCDVEGNSALSLRLVDVIKSAGLYIYGAYEQSRLTIGGVLLEGESGFAISLADANGTSRIRLRVADSGEVPSFDIFDGQNQARLTLGETGLSVQDTSGNARVKVVQTAMGPALAVIDASGQVRGYLAVSEETAMVHLSLSDPNGTVRFDALVDRDGQVRIGPRKRWWWPF